MAYDYVKKNQIIFKTIWPFSSVLRIYKCLQEQTQFRKQQHNIRTTQNIATSFRNNTGNTSELPPLISVIQTFFQDL